MNCYGRGHYGRDSDRDEGPRAKFEEQQLNGHQDAGKGRHEGRRHACCCAGSQQYPALVRRQFCQLGKNRAECRSGLDDGPFRSERPASPDGEGCGQRLQNPDPHSNQALSNQDGFHGFGDPMPLQRGLPVVNHDAYQQAADGGYENNPCPQMVMNRVSNGKRPFPVEGYVGEQIDKLQQALSYQTADESHHECERRGHHDRRLEGLPKFLKPSRARHVLGLCFHHEL